MEPLSQHAAPGRTPFRVRLNDSVAGSLVSIFAAFALLGTPVAAPQEAAPRQQADQAALLEAGRRKFVRSCANQFCHQPDGGGEGPTSLQNRHLNIDRATQIISNGVPGTAMGPWKNKLQAEEIAQLAAFVVSLVPGNAGAHQEAAASAVQPAPAAPEVEMLKAKPNPYHTYTARGEAAVGGNAAAGRSIFFDDTQGGSCAACHTFQGMGGRVGPDLTNVSSKSPGEIMDSIVRPRPAADPRHRTIALTTRQGERYVGIKRDETSDAIRLYDTSSIPPVSRTFSKAAVVNVETLNIPTMPKDYGTRYSHKELLDLVTFLKVGGPNADLMFPHARTGKSSTDTRD